MFICLLLVDHFADALPCALNVAAHQHLGQFAVALRQCLDDLAVLLQRGAGALRVAAGAVAAHAQQLVLFAAEHVHQHLVAAAAHDLVMEIEVAFLLRIHLAALFLDLLFMAVEQLAQLIDLFVGHLRCGDAARHAFQRFAHRIEIGEGLAIQHHHARTGVGYAGDQAHAFQMAQGFAQRAAPHAEAFGQLCLVQLLALRQFAGHDALRQTVRGDIGKRALFGGVWATSINSVLSTICAKY